MNSDSSLILSRRQVREIDRRAIEDYGVPGAVLMENAGRNAAQFLLHLPRRDGPVAIVCGGGNNGGDGFVIARHLANAGVAVELFLACDPDRLHGDAAIHFRIVEKMALSLHRFATPDGVHAGSPLLHRGAVIVDALLGTGFSGAVRSPIDRAIDAINDAPAAVIVAVDVPSGLDCDSGRPAVPTVRAHHTITFVARKIGFDAPGAAAFTGAVAVADIGAPAEIIERVLADAGQG